LQSSRPVLLIGTIKNQREVEHVSTVKLTVNGKAVSAEVEDRTLLVHLLREHLNLTGTHVGCDTSQCGACTVHIDGHAVKSCTVLAGQASGSSVTTIEGIAKGNELHPLQRSFLENAALQCGICTPGFIVAAKALLDHEPNPTEDQIRLWLANNLCRCTGYDKIIHAVQQAAASSREVRA
jgi:aerobic carbon-monoxide dehydrogenase small subunit